MQPISSILFPVDFSPRCRAVVPLVKATAEKLGSKVTLFYAIQPPQAVFAPEFAYPMTVDTEAIVANGRDELLRFYVQAADASAQTVETAVVIGDAAVSIVEYAAAKHIDLIMMPTHGYGRFRGLLLGSVTAKVLHDAACPVWTATHTDSAESPAHAGCRNVMCALDLKSGSADLLRHAADFASRFGAQVRIVHAISETVPGAGAMTGMNFIEFLMDAAREEIDNIQSTVGTRFDVCLSAMPVADWVRQTACHHAADLVVIGRGRLQRGFGRLRTNAYTIIREAPCPVLSF